MIHWIRVVTSGRTPTDTAAGGGAESVETFLAKDDYSEEVKQLITTMEEDVVELSSMLADVAELFMSTSTNYGVPTSGLPTGPVPRMPEGGNYAGLDDETLAVVKAAANRLVDQLDEEVQTRYGASTRSEEQRMAVDKHMGRLRSSAVDLGLEEEALRLNDILNLDTLQRVEAR
eukprot:GHVU01105787.1.p1 GENE.GHVU01105787.1~~GHVU01105787.1.p1  ORF type:complete len:174 (+),score=36.70 GHVU01105787.1:157-678(+)